MTKFPKKIAIIGIGLIGGSIALGLKKHLGQKITILGACNDPKRAQLAKEQGIIDQVITVDKLTREIELIVIATPISVIEEILKQLRQTLLHQVLIIDVGSTKETICQQAESILPKWLSFVGTHPMAGREIAGFEGADPNLFRKKPWIICPCGNIKKGHISLIKRLIMRLGANPIIIDPKTHDEIVTWASHIFLVMARILIGATVKQNSWKAITKIASTGFHDTTRLASHNPEMTRDIILTNKQNILNALEKIKDEIGYLSSILAKERKQELSTYLSRTKQIRDQWLAAHFR